MMAGRARLSPVRRRMSQIEPGALDAYRRKPANFAKIFVPSNANLFLRSSAGFQPAVSPISNRQHLNLDEPSNCSSIRRLEALRYSRLETGWKNALSLVWTRPALGTAGA